MAFHLHRLVMSMVIGLSAAQAQAPGDVRVALVIGNAAYAGAAALTNPVNDAKAMTDTLRNLGFEVVAIHDASRQQMLDGISRIRQRLERQQGIGMLYYAGHGVQLDWHNFMIPLDARLASAADVPAHAVDLEAMLAAFKAAATRMNIVVLDACRDNPFSRHASGKGLAQVDAPPGTLLAYATSPGNLAEDGDGPNGLYTHHLLQELAKPQSRIEDVFKRTRYAVRRASAGRQIPWESTSLEEDFVFNNGKLSVAAQPDARAREQGFALERSAWERIRLRPTVEDLYAFLAKYPSGSFNELAALKLQELQQPQVTAQPAADGTREDDFLHRFRDGDRYEIVTRDGLTGSELSRSAYEFKAVGNGEFRSVTLAGAPFDVRLLRTGHTVQDRLGTWDPPFSAIPGSEFKLGNRASGRAVLTVASGEKIWVDYDTRISAREQIETGFGKVHAYRVDSTGISQLGVRVQSTSWYDPAWGQAIRTRTEERRPGGGAPDIRVREVVARSRKS